MTISVFSKAALCLLATGQLTAHVADLPSADEYRANWPRFRGPDGGGVCAKCESPANPSVVWKSEVPVEGFSSPIVWGTRIFLAGGDENQRVVMCFETASGKLIWQSAVPKTEGSPDDKPQVPDQCGMAAATPATDGRHVFAMYANGDIAAFNFDGSIAWAKHLGVPVNGYGHAASLLTWQDRVIVPFDQGDVDEKLSKLIALDGTTGAEAWKQSRPVGASWATPIGFEAAGRAQIVTLGMPWVISYAPKDGSELWRAECLDGEITPSPIFAGGTLFVVSPSNKLQSMRPDGTGDVTKTHLGWIAEDGIPDVTSPVSNGELVFLIDNGGVLSCYDAKTGRKQWQQDLEGECNASPSIAGSHVVIFMKSGTLITVEAARQFKEVSRFKLEEDVYASPAFAQNHLIVRGLKHLFCLGARAK